MKIYEVYQIVQLHFNHKVRIQTVCVTEDENEAFRFRVLSNAVYQIDVWENGIMIIENWKGDE